MKCSVHNLFNLFGFALLQKLRSVNRCEFFLTKKLLANLKSLEELVVDNFIHFNYGLSLAIIIGEYSLFELEGFVFDGKTWNK